MTSARRWQLLREAWGRPTSDIHALRRARARKAWNRRRQEVARWRRRVLKQLLTQRGYGGLVSLEGAGTRQLYQAYWQATGASRRTFFADLRVLREAREAARLRAGIGAVPAGPGVGTGTGTGTDTDASEGDGASVGPPNPSATSPSPSAAPQSGAPAVPAPGRRELVSSWYWHATALELSLDRLLPPEVAGAVRAVARQYLSRLSPPRRVETTPPLPPPASPPPPVPPPLPDAGDGAPPPAGPDTMTTTALLRAWYGRRQSAADRDRETPDAPGHRSPRSPLPPRRPPAPPRPDPTDWW